MAKTVIIAEIGENHLGNMGIAKKLIKQAAQAGADYVKFQSYIPDNFRKDDPEYDWFKRVSLSDQDHFMLKEYAVGLGIKFLSSPCSLERARFLSENLGLKEVKIASGLMLNFPMLEYANTHFKTVFISTGMATIGEIRKSLSHLNKVKDIYVMHCVSLYPCKYKEANLLSLRTLKKKFPQQRIGYSDHTVGFLASVIAVALGAEVIEKHLTFDRNAKQGTDHVLSVEPRELKAMVDNIRQVEVLLGSESKKPALCERKIKEFVRNRLI